MEVKVKKIKMIEVHHAFNANKNRVTRILTNR